MKTLLAFLVALGASAQVNVNGNRNFLGSFDASNATISRPFRAVSANPSGACVNNNEVVIVSTNGKVWICALGTWVELIGTGNNVTSVFGRTGAIAAQSGDYSADQITNAVSTAGSYANPAWITSLAWGKLTGIPTSFTPSAHTHSAEDVVSGTFADARISASSVTQHQAALSLGASQISSGTFANARISEASVTQYQGSFTLAASQIISGVFNADRIPNLDAAKTTSGVFNPERLGTGTRNGARFLRDDGVWSETPGAVASVFGRTGAITAQAGDYTAAQVTNAVSTAGSYADPSWITSLAYAKITGAPALRYQTIRVNNGSNATQRGRVNFIAGANVTITAGDSPGDDETTITIAATGGGGGFDVATQSEAEDGVDNVKGMTPLRTKQALDFQLPMGLPYAGLVYGVDSAGNRATRPGLGLRVNGGAVLTPFRTNINLIAGANVTITSADNGALDATNVTISTSGGGGGSGPQVVRYAGINSGTVPAWGVSIPLTGGPELLAVEDGVILSSVLRFTANDQYVQAGFALPATFSSVTVRLQARTSSTSGNMAFAFRTACVGSGETLASASWNTAQTITMAASATASGLVQSSPLTATVTGCSANEMFFWRLTRTSDTTTANPPDLVSIAMEVQ